MSRRYCQMHRNGNEVVAGTKRKQTWKQPSTLGEFSMLVLAASMAHHVELPERLALGESGQSEVVLESRPMKRSKRDLHGVNSHDGLCNELRVRPNAPCAELPENKKAGGAVPDSRAARLGRSDQRREDGKVSASPPFLPCQAAGRSQPGLKFAPAIDLGPVELTRVGLSSLSRVARAMSLQASEELDREHPDLTASSGMHSDPLNESPSKRKVTSQRGLSRFVGVRRRPWGTYGAEICTPEGRVWLGTFDTEALAASAYDDAARFIRGKAAITNFGEGSEEGVALPTGNSQVELLDGDALIHPSNPETSTETEIDMDLDADGKGPSSTKCDGSIHRNSVTQSRNNTGVKVEKNTSRTTKPVDCSSVEKYVQESRSLGVRKITSGRYEASVYNKLTKKMIYVGRFDTREEAVVARDKVIASVIVDNKDVHFPMGAGGRKRTVDEGPSNSKLVVDGQKSFRGTDDKQGKASGGAESGPVRLSKQDRKVPTMTESCTEKQAPGVPVSVLPRHGISEPKGSEAVDCPAEQDGADRQLSPEAKLTVRENLPVLPRTSSGGLEHKLFGVTKKWSTGRYEASFYDRNEKRKVYVGMFETDLEAACARDQLAVQSGATSHINFPEWASKVASQSGGVGLASGDDHEQADRMQTKVSGARDRALQIAHWMKKKTGDFARNKNSLSTSGERSAPNESIPYAVPPQEFSRSDHSNFSSEEYVQSEDPESDSLTEEESDSEYKRMNSRRYLRAPLSSGSGRSRVKRKRGTMLHKNQSSSTSGGDPYSEDGQDALGLEHQTTQELGNDFRLGDSSPPGFPVEDYFYQDLKSEYGRVYRTTSKRRAMLGKTRLNPGSAEDASNILGSPVVEIEEHVDCTRATSPVESTSMQGKEMLGTLNPSFPGVQNRFPIEPEKPEIHKDLPNDQSENLKRSPRRCPYIGVQATAGGRFKSKMYLAATKQHIYVGTFDSAVDAAKAYDDMVFKRSGNIKRLNFPERYGLNLPAAKKQKVKARRKTTTADGAASRGSNLTSRSGRFDSTKYHQQHQCVFGSSKVGDKAQANDVKQDVTVEEDREGLSEKRQSFTGDNNSFAANTGLMMEADIPLEDEERKRRQRKPGKTLHRHYKGVYSNGMKFKCIYYNPLAKRHTYLGSFVTAEEAARVYDQLWFWQFGESPNLKLSPRELLPSSASCYHPLSNGSGGYYGVCETGGLYHAMFYNDKNHIPFYCGNFKTALEAARAYDRAAYKERGAEAKLNFPEDFGEKSKKMLTPMWAGVSYEDEPDVASNMEDALVEVGGISEFGDVVRREKLAVRRDMAKLTKESSGDME